MIEDSPYLWLAGVLACIFLINKWPDYNSPDLNAIPAVCPTGRLSCFYGAYKFFRNGQAVIQEGIEKYKSAVFRVPMMNRWAVVVSQPKQIEDIRQARDDDLSFYDAINDTIQTEYTFGREFIGNHYHVNVLRSSLTRSLASRFGDIRDEIATAFGEIIKLEGNEWTPLPALDTVRQVVCRTSNRLFVGLPLCRDPDYCDLNIKLTINIFTAISILNAVPRFLRPILGPMLSPMSRALKRAQKHLEPLVEQRIREDAEFGPDRPERPNDLISWLIDAAPETEKNVQSYTRRILAVNFSAIHTSSNSFALALFHLAAAPEYIQPLREEVEAVICEEGWTKAAIGKMRKVDSFIRESFRHMGLGALVMDRYVRKPAGFTFSDGTHLPQGTFITCAEWAIHHQEDKYPNPFEFDGFRFSNMREEDGESMRHQMVNTALDYLPFGHGRHACPGRFFAANELKAMLAHVVLSYDVKLEEDKLPPCRWLGPIRMINREARVMFRKRLIQ